ncbi:hypothetical protein NA57DRAFT_25866, partial [Rhizodiscina lignyota]
WFHVQASDYLERDNSLPDLESKLRHYLKSQGVHGNEWQYAYLVTAPRFLGYSFNPASFWYLYDQKHVLKKMIIEVNNTFGERRMYLLNHETLDSNEIDSQTDISKLPFKHSWEKDFHVSPFNSRKGSYTLAAEDPFSSGKSTPGHISNTLVLRSSKGHAKIIARLYSDRKAIDPRILGFVETIKFLSRWWWVGLLSFPRILKEAFKLFFSRKLHIWFRPEVLQSSIGRSSTNIEKELETFFRRYIKNTVDNSVVPLRVTYKPAGGPADTFCSGAVSDNKPDSSRYLEIRVLTPAFYSRFVHYSYTSEAFDRESLFTDEKNRTVWISDPELLYLLFPNREQSSDVSSTLHRASRLDSVRWKVHKTLRCSPAPPAYPVMPASPEMRITDIRPSVLSPLDSFVQSSCSDGWLYRRCCTTLFLANRFAFGIPEIVSAVDLGVRILLCI